MKTWRVVFTVELESHVDAETEEEALLVAREGFIGLEDGGVVIEETATVWEDDTDDSRI